MNGRDLDTPITFERYTATQDGSGEETQTWSQLAARDAKVFFGRGDERRQAAMQQGEQPATFQVLNDEVTRTVTLKDRIVYDGANWDIEGRAVGRLTIEFTAVRAA